MVAVEKGKWLSEAVLWTTWTHAGIARSSAETRLLVLDAKQFQEIIGTFPSDHAKLYAAVFVDLLNLTEPTDLGASVDDISRMITSAFPLDESDSDDSNDGQRVSIKRPSGRN